MPDKHNDTELLDHASDQPRSAGNAAWMLLLAALLSTTSLLPGCGQDEGATSPDVLVPVAEPPEPSAQVARPSIEAEPKAPNLKALWEALVPDPEPREGTQTVEIALPLGSSGPEANTKQLAGIRLPEQPSKNQVRVYVGTILRVAGEDRGVFGASDPEVDAIVRVGPEHVDVLIEPLVHLAHFNGEIYVVEALKKLVTDDHKDQVLTNLAAAPALVGVVVHRGWTEDAATTLFKVLAERDPYLDVDWVEAAASVAGPEQYEDLKFHLRRNVNHFNVWKAIRDLPGIEPLEPSIVSAWRGTSREDDPYGWGQLALVAAHYGHVEGLEFVVEDMGRSMRAWRAFQNLTGHAHDVSFPFPEAVERAQEWFAAHKDRMEFDRARGRYIVRKP